jgi:hypothetical protein
MNKILFLKISLLAGAVFDGLVLFPMLSPEIGGTIFGISNFNPGMDYKYAMAIAASLMAGWTCLLIWGAMKPIARKSIFLLTVCPVLTGLILSGIYAVESTFIPLGSMIPTWIGQSVLVALYIYSYFLARSIERTGIDP